jgi:hypothetical protein
VSGFVQGLIKHASQPRSFTTSDLGKGGAEEGEQGGLGGRAGKRCAVHTVTGVLARPRMGAVATAAGTTLLLRRAATAAPP